VQRRTRLRFQRHVSLWLSKVLCILIIVSKAPAGDTSNRRGVCYSVSCSRHAHAPTCLLRMPLLQVQHGCWQCRHDHRKPQLQKTPDTVNLPVRSEDRRGCLSLRRHICVLAVRLPELVRLSCCCWLPRALLRSCILLIGRLEELVDVVVRV